MKDTKDILIPNRITLKNGHGKLPYLLLNFKGAEAHVYLHGAHVLHYQPAKQAPVLWHSPSSWFEAEKPIRGGVPICWPWFGGHPKDASKPSHGIARTSTWELIDSLATETATSITLKLPEATYPNATLQLVVELSDKLYLNLKTTNTGNSNFVFTEALHSYFDIEDINNVTVTGLEDQNYINQLAPEGQNTQKGPIAFTEETDRIYTNSNQDCTIIDSKRKRKIRVSKENSLSTVVWNPWTAKSIKMPDFGAQDFNKMVCVETANCGPNPITLQPGNSHELKLNISSQSF